ncbi:MAG: PTS sugar transporter subunit IIA [Collinsella sp.]|nr:PTS sugar transporter subunit IIA [Collinsella sp.]
MNDLIIHRELMFPNLDADDAEGAIRKLGGALLQSGCIESGYIECVIERERSFPTGIEFPSGPIALPHGDAALVRSSAISVGRCSSPILFQAMGDKNNTLQVGIIIMLAVGNPDGHLEVLSRLMDALSDDSFCRAVRDAAGGDEMADVFSRYLLGEVAGHGHDF